jgi:serine/threonine protein kinase
MFKVGDVIDSRYKVEGVCSDGGGMGAVLFVRRINVASPKRRVLKYCKDTAEEAIKRFKREVRLMNDFKGNNKVVQVVYSNLDHDPPYFVMDHFEQGDLTSLVPTLKGEFEAQEKLFSAMIDCIAELHAEGVFHRDIKPQNFLRSGTSLAVSDLGLSTETNSSTLFTRSSQYWGTPGYLPPEFQLPGGFKNAEASSDVFMLGKTFYYLLTGRDPMYLIQDDVPAPLMVIIERCCAPLKAGRYQSLASLKQSLSAAYDVLLGRVVGSALAHRTLRSIVDRLKTSNKYRSDEVKTFVEALSALEEKDREELCKDLPSELYPVLAQSTFAGEHRRFLEAYQGMVESGGYGWAYAETIASNMRQFFESSGVSDVDKVHALRTTDSHSECTTSFTTCRTRSLQT